MQLTYRGVRYTPHNQQTSVIETAQTGRFLGARFQIKSARGIAPKSQKHQLSYRLAKYST